MSVYGNAGEELPHNMPVPHGNPGCITCFVDANLYHDLTTGCAAMGVLHLVNPVYS